jgi:hypothetical protein
MAEVKKIGRATFRKLTDEEALRECGTSFVFVGTPPVRPPLKTGTKKPKRRTK